MKLNKSFAGIIIACMLLAMAIPAVAAAEYPHNAQFLPYNDPNKLGKPTVTLPGTPGHTYVNPAYKSKMLTRNLLTTQVTPSSTDWPQFHYNAVHDGYSPSTGLPDDNSTVWSTYFPAIGPTNPIIANGKVFILTNYSGMYEPDDVPAINLTCLDEATGSILWQTSGLSRLVHWGSWSSPATDGDYVYVSTDNQHYAIDANTGQIAWTFTSFNTNVNGGPSIASDSDLVFVSDSGDYYDVSKSGHYYALNKTNNGSRVWTFDNSKTTTYDFRYAQASPAYDPSDKSVYVTGYNNAWPGSGADRGYLYKVDATTGDELWGGESVYPGDYFAGSASFDADNVYVTSYNSTGSAHLYAYSKSNGAPVWNASIKSSDATPAIADGIVYVSGGTAGSSPHGVYAFYTDDGSVVWCLDDDNTPTCHSNPEDLGGWTDSVSIADGYAFIGHENGTYPIYSYDKVYALNAFTGDIIWFYQQGGSTAAIANSKMYTLGNNGDLYRFG